MVIARYRCRSDANAIRNGLRAQGIESVFVERKGRNDWTVETSIGDFSKAWRLTWGWGDDSDGDPSEDCRIESERIQNMGDAE